MLFFFSVFHLVTPLLSVNPAVSMGRSRSTPGLVESRGKVPLEEMPMEEYPNRPPSTSDPDNSGRFRTTNNFLSPSASYAVQPAYSLHSCASDSTNADRTNVLSAAPSSPYRTRSPLLGSKDFTSNLDQRYPPPPPLPFATGSPYPGREILLAEVKRLRERLVSLEADNATMSLKLSQQQWDVESRLAEIELQLCTATTTTSPSIPSPDDNNQESII